MIGVTCVSLVCSVILHADFSSYHLLIGGSLLQSFTLFMLSLAKPGQYYQVRHPAIKISYELFNRIQMIDFACPRSWPRNSSGTYICPVHGNSISLFPPASYAGNEPRRCWLLAWRGYKSHHVELLVQPGSRLCQRCANKRCPYQRPASYWLSPGPHAVGTS